MVILTRVERWYDRHTRVWVIQGFDPNDYQIGNAQFAGIKAGAIAIEKDWRKMLGKDIDERDLI